MERSPKRLKLQSESCNSKESLNKKKSSLKRKRTSSSSKSLSSEKSEFTKRYSQRLRNKMETNNKQTDIETSSNRSSRSKATVNEVERTEALEWNDSRKNLDSTSDSETPEFSSSTLAALASEAGLTPDAFAGLFNLAFGHSTSAGNSSLGTLKELLSDLKKDSSHRLVALQSMADILCVATEETFLGSRSVGFSMEELTKALIDIVKNPTSVVDEAALGIGPELILLSCRCLSNLLEAFPSASAMIVQNKGTEILVEKLLQIEFIDLAEQVLSVLLKISAEYPSAIIHANGLIAVLQYIDFFGIHVQRNAITIAANACKGLESVSMLNFGENSSSDVGGIEQLFNTIKGIVPMLEGLLKYSDTKIVEQAVVCIGRIIDWGWKQNQFEDLFQSHEILLTMVKMIFPSSSTAVSPFIFTSILKSLWLVTKGSPNLGFVLASDLSMIERICHILKSSDEEAASFTDASDLVQPTEHLLHLLSLTSEILPKLPQDGFWRIKVDKEKDPSEFTRITRSISAKTNQVTSKDSERMELLKKHSYIFSKYLDDLLPLLLRIFSTTVSFPVKKSIVECVLKCVYFSVNNVFNASLQKKHKISLTRFLENGLGTFISELLNEKDYAFSDKNLDQQKKEALVMVIGGILLCKNFCNCDVEEGASFLAREGVFRQLRRICQTIEQKSSGAVKEIMAKRLDEEERSKWMKRLNVVRYDEIHSDTESEGTSKRLLDLKDSLAQEREFSDSSDDMSLLQFVKQLEPSEHTTESSLVWLQSMKNAIERIGKAPVRTPQAFGDETFSYIEAEEWCYRVALSILDQMPLSEDSSLMELETIAATLKESKSSINDLLSVLKKLALNVSGSQKKLTSYELLESGILLSLMKFLTEDRLAESDQVPTLDLSVRQNLFLHVFLNTSSPVAESFFVPFAFKMLIQRIQEVINRTERFGVLAALYNFEGADKKNLSYQLSKQIRVKIVPKDPSLLPKAYSDGMTVNIHAAATLKQIEEFLRAKFESSFLDALAAKRDANSQNSCTSSEEEDDFFHHSFSGIEEEDTMDITNINESVLEDEKKKKEKSPGPSRRKEEQKKQVTVEFLVDEQIFSSDTTIYAVLHHLKTSKKGENANMAYSTIPITFSLQLGDGSTNKQHETVLIPVDEQLSPWSAFNLLRILYELNSRSNEGLDESRVVVPFGLFQNKKVASKMNKQLNQPLIVVSKLLPDWSHYVTHRFSFLVPFETRLVYLQSTAFGYARSLNRWQKNQPRTEDSLIGRISRQKVRIYRAKLLESMIKVMDLYGTSQHILEVEFFDEVGTGLGPTLEFYADVCKLVRLQNGVKLSQKETIQLWRKEDSTEEYITSSLGLFPAPLSKKVLKSSLGKKLLLFMKSLGIFVAKALYDSRIIDLPLNKHFLERFIHPNVTGSLDSIEFVDPSLSKSLQFLGRFVAEKQVICNNASLSSEEKDIQLNAIRIDGVSVQDLGLDFTLPGYTIELIPKGASVDVTLDNIEEYIEKVVDLTVGSGVQMQIDAFRDGFDLVFCSTNLGCFSCDELSLLLGCEKDEDWGYEVILDAIKTDHGYTNESPVVQYLIKLMSEFTRPERRRFLQFVTGAVRLPIGGFRNLQPRLTIVRKPADQPDDYLPSVMTCVNYLKVPSYTSFEVLQQRFMTAIEEGTGSFHLS